MSTNLDTVASLQEALFKAIAENNQLSYVNRILDLKLQAHITIASLEQEFAAWGESLRNHAGTQEYKAKKREGVVYLVKALVEPIEPAAYKIGHTKDITSRAATFGNLFPFNVEVIHTIQCYDRIYTEKLFHAYYAKKRLTGEFFNLDEEDIREFKMFTRIGYDNE